MRGMMPEVADAYRAHFDAVAARYDDLRADPHPEDVARLVSLGDLAGRSVLDVGCSTGRLAAILADGHGCRVTGLDASAAMIARARERGVHAVHGRADALPSGAKSYWLADVFPSYVAIDSARFPDAATLGAELRAAGFAETRWIGYERRLTYSREHALERLRGRFASSLALLSEDEYRDGLARAERELPDPVRTVLRLAVVLAH
jgi:SAM-dependent methyltransferase